MGSASPFAPQRKGNTLQEAGCVGDLLLDVREAPFAGYPVVQSREDMSIMGLRAQFGRRDFNRGSDMGRSTQT